MAYQQPPYFPSLHPMNPHSPPFSPGGHISSVTLYNSGHQHLYTYPNPIPVDDAQYDSNIHPYWKERIVPRPGFRSSRTLGSQESNRILIKAPKKSYETQVKVKQLLPPLSHNKSIQHKGPTQDDEETKENSSDQGVHVTPVKFHGLDKYAPSFVPQCLKNIQREMHQLEPLPPVAPFPPTNYSSTFLLPHFVQGRESQLLSRTPSPPDANSPLDPYHYSEHWTPILQTEVDCLCSQRGTIVLWSVNDLKVTDWKRNEFRLAVPGLRENYPRLEVGDLVKLRLVIPSQNGFTEPFFKTGIAFEARVIASQKREGAVHLYAPPLEEYILSHWTGIALYLAQTDGHIPFQLPLTFNISFLVNARPYCLMESAVADLAKLMGADAGDSLTTKWLFPQVKNMREAPPWLSNSQNCLKWTDSELNEEQKDAVASIALRQWPVPYLISGPAGTGKTRTIVETVLQILFVQSDACILLCAPSNPATDTLVLRLRNSLKPSEMLRLNDQGRTINQVPSKLLQYCYIDASAENKFSIPPFKELMKYRVVACSCIDANILADAQCTNRVLMALENEVLSSIHPHSTPTSPKPHWTHLIIDEAAQGSEPELCIPISVVATTQSSSTTSLDGAIGSKIDQPQPQLVLCGDRYQLGPIVTSDEARKAELDMSLLQRLFELPLYADEGISASFPRPSAHLRKNYRSHPAILMPPSALFYNDTLVPFANNGNVSWSGLDDSRLPVRIIGCESPEECIDEKSTWYNLGEIEVVMRTVRSLLKEADSCYPVLKARNIGIISPFRAQVWKLRELLREENLRDVDVGTVEVPELVDFGVAFTLDWFYSTTLGIVTHSMCADAVIRNSSGQDWQGRENRVIIVSCVRSSARFLEDDYQKGLGLFQEPKRMNVAITRARELLVITGNPWLLKKDSYWKPYLQFALRNNLYEGPTLDIETDGNYISKLEASLVHTGAADKTADPEKLGVLVSGIVAGEVLRE